MCVHNEKHRESRTGGGVAICIRDWLSFSQRPDISVFSPDIESVFVEINKDQLGSKQNIVIGTIYRPPGNDLDTFNIELGKLLDILHKENKAIYFCPSYYQLIPLH